MYRGLDGLQISGDLFSVPHWTCWAAAGEAYSAAHAISSAALQELLLMLVFECAAHRLSQVFLSRGRRGCCHHHHRRPSAAHTSWRREILERHCLVRATEELSQSEAFEASSAQDCVLDPVAAALLRMIARPRLVFEGVDVALIAWEADRTSLAASDCLRGLSAI